METIGEIQGLHSGENVAVLRHRFSILGLVYSFLGLSLIEFQLDSASITLVEIFQSKPTLISYNAWCHLEGLENNGKEH